MNNFEKIMTLVLRNNIFVGKSDYSFELPMLFIQDNKVYMALITTFSDTEVGVITFCFQDGSIKYYTKEEFVRYKVVTINSSDKDTITKDFVNFTEEELIKDFTDIIDKYINEKQLDIDKYNNYLDKVIKSTEDEYGRIYISKFKI
ncbi:MAG: hypothetical protein ACI4OT_02065 [Bacilli bacterium]